MTSAATFPGGIGVSELAVYDTAAVDGLSGGSPHMHLVSTEAYAVIGGRGALQTIDATGFRETPLSPGSVVWFTPGTIHRAINDGDLRVMVLMSNAGLPEAGDAVMTFPPEHLVDAETYAAAASLDGPGGTAERGERAARRRDLAVQGFLRLRDAVREGRAEELQEFYAAAGALVRDASATWGPMVAEGPLSQARHSLDLAGRVAEGDVSHLALASVAAAPKRAAEAAFGMCGRLHPRL